MARRRRDRAAELKALYARLPEVACKGLCADSCGPIDMSPLERQQLRLQGVRIPLPQEALRQLRQVGDYSCPALREGRCTVHEQRPAICRMWGTVVSLACPHGCTVSPSPLPDSQAFEILLEIHAIE